MQAYAKLQMRTEEKDMSYNIAVIPGDGIGPEIVREAQKAVSYTHLDVYKRQIISLIKQCRSRNKKGFDVKVM